MTLTTIKDGHLATVPYADGKFQCRYHARTRKGIPRYVVTLECACPCGDKRRPVKIGEAATPAEVAALIEAHQLSKS